MKSKLKAVFRLLQNQARRLLESSPGSNSSTPKALLRALSFSSTSKHKPEEMAESAVKSWWLDKIHQNFKPLYEKTLLSSWSDADWWLGSPRFEVYRCDWFLWKVFCLWDGWCPRRVVSSWGRTPWCFHCVVRVVSSWGRTPWCFHCVDPASLVVGTDFRARWPLQSWPWTPLMARRLIQLVGWRLSLSPLRRNETDEKSMPSLEDWSLRLTLGTNQDLGCWWSQLRLVPLGGGLPLWKETAESHWCFSGPLSSCGMAISLKQPGAVSADCWTWRLSVSFKKKTTDPQSSKWLWKKNLARIVKNSWKPR